MNKFNKGRTIGIVATSLAAVSLLGVGFSTWIISTKTDTSVSGISVTVADTNNISVKIDNAALSTTDNSVTFDADATKMNAANGHLLSCSSTDKEDLSFTLTYDVTVGKEAKAWQIMAAIDDGTDGTNGKFATAVTTRKYIALPSTLGITTGVECLNQASTTNADSGLTVTGPSEVTENGSTCNKYSISQKFTFTWGLAFANKNPVEVTSTDNIYTQDSKTEAATIETLIANTKAMKALELSTFKVILSVGTVSMN